MKASHSPGRTSLSDRRPLCAPPYSCSCRLASQLQIRRACALAAPRRPTALFAASTCWLRVARGPLPLRRSGFCRRERPEAGPVEPSRRCPGKLLGAARLGLAARAGMGRQLTARRRRCHLRPFPAARGAARPSAGPAPPSRCAALRRPAPAAAAACQPWPPPARCRCCCRCCCQVPRTLRPLCTSQRSAVIGWRWAWAAQAWPPPCCSPAASSSASEFRRGWIVAVATHAWL